MSVRRLASDQPPAFSFTPENLAWATAKMAEYPPGKQASAVIPILWRVQEQEGWISEPAIRCVGEMLDMAYIRVYEVATFYTQFQLAPVGKTAHVQVCGTTPCMLRGAKDIIGVCKSRIHAEQFHHSADGGFSWEEVECLGACVNAPMVMIGNDTYEDLTAASFGAVLDGFAAGRPPIPGPQIDRQLSAPVGGETTLTDPKLYDGSRIGAWRGKFEEREKAKSEAAGQGRREAAEGLPLPWPLRFPPAARWRSSHRSRPPLPRVRSPPPPRPLPPLQRVTFQNCCRRRATANPMISS